MSFNPFFPRFLGCDSISRLARGGATREFACPCEGKFQGDIYDCFRFNPGLKRTKITQNPVRRTLSGEEQVWTKGETREGKPKWIRIEPSRTRPYGGLILQASFLELDSGALRDIENTFFFVALDCFPPTSHVPCFLWIGRLLSHCCHPDSWQQLPSPRDLAGGGGGAVRERKSEREKGAHIACTFDVHLQTRAGRRTARLVRSKLRR